MPRRPDEGARERILETAARLFHEHGVRAVGMQQIIDECSCGKSLLYREFPSKDDLVVAWLEHCRGNWAGLVHRVAAGHPGDPAAQMVAIIRAIADDVSAPDYRGCALRNTYVEFHDGDHPAHQVAVDHIRSMRDHLRALARQADAPDPDTLGDRLMLVLDGLYTNGIVMAGDAAPAAVALAEELVAAALGTTPATRR